MSSHVDYHTGILHSHALSSDLRENHAAGNHKGINILRSVDGYRLSVLV